MKARTFENAVLSAINLGGDADTVGACCGALAGAYWGVDAVPERWSRVVEGYDQVVRVAGQLWEAREDCEEGKIPGPDRDDIVQGGPDRSDLRVS
jgi:ADP-ribosyl-[dinitrogen reductase] hydrolase